MVRTLLRAEGHTTLGVLDGETALKTVRSSPVDLLILDINMPGLDGLNLLLNIRSSGNMTPVIFLTAKTEPSHQRLGLDLGGDDYVTKPFDPALLAARVRSLLRRSRLTPRPSVLTVEDLVIDVDARTVTAAGSPVTLSPLEFELLVALANNAGKAVRRQDLLRSVWGTQGSAKSLTEHVRRLRGKLDAAGSTGLISTINGVGYKLG
ncbi:DNA-binding response regulator [Bailinhaonella thermotolerans]|uniref:DNA-binding response regulator n=2 Tax=Bailinhaonella thermotolerans TaxID=1070861 RepID=A0A3A4A543_9ACTN|nr:DNA-binding response regulator [Bailinhaonella thermotolerans]